MYKQCGYDTVGCEECHNVQHTVLVFSLLIYFYFKPHILKGISDMISEDFIKLFAEFTISLVFINYFNE